MYCLGAGMSNTPLLCRSGAFIPGLPVQPVVLRYPNSLVNTPSFDAFLTFPHSLNRGRLHHETVPLPNTCDVMVSCLHVSVSSSCAEWLHPLAGWYFIPTVSLNLSLFHTHDIHTQPCRRARTQRYHISFSTSRHPLINNAFHITKFFLSASLESFCLCSSSSPALVTVLTYVTTWQHKAIKLGNKSPGRKPPHVSFYFYVKFMTWSYLILSKTVCFRTPSWTFRQNENHKLPTPTTNVKRKITKRGFIEPLEEFSFFLYEI